MAHDVFRRALGNHLTEVECDDPSDQAHEFAQLVFDQQHREALVGVNLPDQCRQIGDFTAAQPGKGLVEQQQRRPGSQRTRDLQASLVAVGEHFHRHALLASQADPPQQRLRPGIEIDALTPFGAERADDDVFEHAHADERSAELERARDATPGNAVRRQAQQRTAFEEHRGARVGCDEARQQVVQGGLAGAVRTEDADDLAGLDRERHVLDGVQATEVLVEVGHLQQSAHFPHPIAVLKRCQVGAIKPFGRKNRIRIRVML